MNTVPLQEAQHGGAMQLFVYNAKSLAAPHLRERERERELRREGGKSLLAYVKGVDPHLKVYSSHLRYE